MKRGKNVERGDKRIKQTYGAGAAASGAPSKSRSLRFFGSGGSGAPYF